MDKRLFLIVLDSFGMGELPDAAEYGDTGSNTLLAVAGSPEFHAPNLRKLGLFNIDGAAGGEPVEEPIASFARMAERSAGKDTIIGHWEIAGLISKKALPTYPEGFPKELMDQLSREIRRPLLCGLPYSGTKVLQDYGVEHTKTGAPIVYTSADSVMQIAAHERVVELSELYRICEVARSMMRGEHGVGRIIARPFTGRAPNFTRTPNRHDYALSPTHATMLDVLQKRWLDVIAIGKIHDIFAGRGITHSVRTTSNADGMEKAIQLAKQGFSGLCFVNLVDFDMLYGHRNDIDGYAKAISEFDVQLGELMECLLPGDAVILTADHGCDPSTPSTDHSREYVPMLMFGHGIRQGVNLGTRPTFADIAATVQDYFTQPIKTAGESFLAHTARDFEDDDKPMMPSELIAAALHARGNAYAPYSGYEVGAAIECANGHVYLGCNIENASYPVACCGERTALFKAVSEGQREFRAIAIVGGKAGEAAPLSGYASPCGVCRQALSEFSPDMKVYVAKSERDYREYTLRELLPDGFTL